MLLHYTFSCLKRTNIPIESHSLFHSSTQSTPLLFSCAFQGVIILVGLVGLVLCLNVEVKGILPPLIKELLPVGIRGIAAAGLFAVMMSTADSHLHAAGLSFTHDVVKVFRG